MESNLLYGKLFAVVHKIGPVTRYLTPFSTSDMYCVEIESNAARDVPNSKWCQTPEIATYHRP